jgi:putative protease
VEFFGPNGTHFKQKITEIRDEGGKLLDAARHPLQLVKLAVDQQVNKWDMMRKITFK